MKRSLCLLLFFVAAEWAQSSMVRDLSCVVAPGSGTAYACNIAVAPGTYASNDAYSVQADVANAGAAAVDFNSLGAKSIRRFGGRNLVANDQGRVVGEPDYDGTNMQSVCPAGQYRTATQMGAAPATAGTSGLKGNGSGGTSAAAAADMITPFSSCSGTQFWERMGLAIPRAVAAQSRASLRFGTAGIAVSNPKERGKVTDEVAAKVHVEPCI